MHVVTMQGPGKNSLGTKMMRGLIHELQEADGAPVLLTGHGDAFSAGLNLKEVADLDRDGMRAFLELLEQTVTALFTYPGPTAAAVNGHAIAGGCVLALCCDWRVGTTNPRTRIGLNEVAIGLPFPPRTFEAVCHRISKTHLDAVLLGGQLCDTSRALALGLLDVLDEDPMAAATAWLDRVRRNPPAAYAAVKHDLRGDLTPTEATQQQFLDRVLPMWTDDAVRRRVLAALGR